MPVPVTAMRLVIGSDTVGFRFKKGTKTNMEYFDVANGFLNPAELDFLTKQARSYNVLIPVGDQYISKKEQSGEITVEEVSHKPEVIKQLLEAMGYGASSSASAGDMNPKMTGKEKELYDKLKSLHKKHIFTNKFSDGEINKLTRKNDLSGMWVYFHSNMDGEIKLDAEEFLADIVQVG